MSDIEGMDDLQRRLDAIKDTKTLLGQIGLRAVARAKELVPRKTGNLGRTIRLGQVTDNDAQILAGGQNGVGYAAAVEYGTRPHEIVPRYKKALAWGGNRRLSGSLRSGSKSTFFAKRVRHPGTQPYPFLMPAAKEVAEQFPELIIRAWNEAA